LLNGTAFIDDPGLLSRPGVAFGHGWLDHSRRHGEFEVPIGFAAISL
jgi:hypothetical protein